ncbi:hypothetical protein [Teichococcus aestuarii]|uniref:hypothetical protein n=1 Tax=Teichococcus aestuarii TaxID=568898 RepID=UPI0036239CA2
MIKIVSRLPRAGGVISSQLVALGCALAGMLAWEAAEALWPGTHGPALLLPAIALAGAVGGRPGGVGCVLFLSLLTLGEELALGHGTLSGGEALTLLAAGLLVALVAGELRHVTDEETSSGRPCTRWRRWARQADGNGTWPARPSASAPAPARARASRRHGARLPGAVAQPPPPR